MPSMLRHKRVDFGERTPASETPEQQAIKQEAQRLAEDTEACC
jgi:hypothetical protein